MAIKWGLVASSVLTVVAIAGAPACALFAKNKAGVVDPRWFGGQVAFVLLAAAVPAFAAWRRKKSEVTGRARAQSQITETVNPILRNIARRTSQKRQNLGDQITSMAVQAAANMFAPDAGRTRSCYYELEAGADDNAPKRLTLVTHVGREEDTPLGVFDGSNDRGQAAIELVETDNYLLCENVEKSPPKGWSNDGDATYKTFISAGVVALPTAYGMLTVDAPKPGDLTRYDAAVLRSLACLIALARTIEDAVPAVGQQQ
jgi:hypothetical protein